MRRESKTKSNPQERAFVVVALEWWEQQRSRWSEDYQIKLKRMITNDAKKIAKMDVSTIDSWHVSELMLAVEASGAPTKASVLLSVINRVYGYAIARRLTKVNPAQGLQLKDILKPRARVKHRAAILNPNDLGRLISDIDNTNSGQFCTVHALRLIPRIFVRPKEIRELKWKYVDFESCLIQIPDSEMKTGREHLIPMAKQVVQHLREIQEYTGYSEFVFPNQRDSSKPISKNVLTNRLRDLGYGADVMSAHGFRSTASTILHEQGWEHDVVETQLAHLVGSATSRAYNRAMYLQQRKNMMQEWADYLDRLSKSNSI